MNKKKQLKIQSKPTSEPIKIAPDFFSNILKEHGVKTVKIKNAQERLAGPVIRKK